MFRKIIVLLVQRMDQRYQIGGGEKRQRIVILVQIRDCEYTNWVLVSWIGERRDLRDKWVELVGFVY